MKTFFREGDDSPFPRARISVAALSRSARETVPRDEGLLRGDGVCVVSIGELAQGTKRI